MYVEPDLGGADHLGEPAPPVTVMVRVDRDAFLRGHAQPGELCELDGQGPIPVPLARALAVDSFLSVVFTEAGDIRAISHLGRTINPSCAPPWSSGTGCVWSRGAPCPMDWRSTT